MTWNLYFWVPGQSLLGPRMSSWRNFIDYPAHSCPQVYCSWCAIWKHKEANKSRNLFGLHLMCWVCGHHLPSPCLIVAPAPSPGPTWLSAPSLSFWTTLPCCLGLLLELLPTHPFLRVFPFHRMSVLFHRYMPLAHCLSPHCHQISSVRAGVSAS